jgi:transposase
MGARGYRHIQKMLPLIKAMMAEGKSHREIEQELGLTGERPIHHALKRERRKERKGINEPKRKGRPRKTPIIPEHEIELRVKELEREVRLLRDFLHAAGRM